MSHEGTKLRETVPGPEHTPEQLRQQFNLRSVVQTSQAVPKGAAFLFAGIDEFLYALALTFAASE